MLEIGAVSRVHIEHASTMLDCMEQTGRMNEWVLAMATLHLKIKTLLIKKIYRGLNSSISSRVGTAGQVRQ